MKMTFGIGYYLLVNLITFAVYRADKQKAQKHQYRIPEKTLFLFAFLGGAVGAVLGMCFFHHKTKKIYFWILNGFALAVHIALIFYIKLS